MTEQVQHDGVCVFELAQKRSAENVDTWLHTDIQGRHGRAYGGKAKMEEGIKTTMRWICPLMAAKQIRPKQLRCTCVNDQAQLGIFRPLF